MTIQIKKQTCDECSGAGCIYCDYTGSIVLGIRVKEELRK